MTAQVGRSIYPYPQVDRRVALVAALGAWGTKTGGVEIGLGKRKCSGMCLRRLAPLPFSQKNQKWPSRDEQELLADATPAAVRVIAKTVGRFQRWILFPSQDVGLCCPVQVGEGDG